MSVPKKLEGLLGPKASEVSCDRCFELLDQYVELEVEGLDADRTIPGMKAHLEGCAACAEDHEALLQLLRLQG